jgi:hypothetical protein
MNEEDREKAIRRQIELLELLEVKIKNLRRYTAFKNVCTVGFWIILGTNIAYRLIGG